MVIELTEKKKIISDGSNGANLKSVKGCKYQEDMIRQEVERFLEQRQEKAAERTEILDANKGTKEQGIEHQDKSWGWKEKRGICFRYRLGLTCKYGKECKFRHFKLKENKEDNICNHYTRFGECKYGNECYNYHVTDQEWNMMKSNGKTWRRRGKQAFPQEDINQNQSFNNEQNQENSSPIDRINFLEKQFIEMRQMMENKLSSIAPQLAKNPQTVPQSMMYQAPRPFMINQIPQIPCYSNLQTNVNQFRQRSIAQRQGDQSGGARE